MRLSLTITCPKCQATSGDDWSQCGRSCPMPMSPYFDETLPKPLRDEAAKQVSDSIKKELEKL